MLGACDPFGTEFADEEPAQRYEADEPSTVAPPDVLKIMTYNVKFGGGRIDFFFDCHGERVLMSREEVLGNMEGIGEVIRELDPDVLFVQEADVASKRAAYVDQVDWLLQNTALNYGVYASHWKADFVPSGGLGPVDSGNAILSKFPLKDAKRIALPLREDQGGLEKYFYLRRNILVADLELEGKEPIRLVGTHLAAYSHDGTKEKQLKIFEEQLQEAAGRVIGAGDLNTLPPGSEKQSEFPDSVCTDDSFQADDYLEEGDFLVGLYESFTPAIPLEAYQADNSPHFTHTTSSDGVWNRKLDYVFTDLAVIAGSGRTHQDAVGEMSTMDLSDHAPITVEVELP